MSFLSSLFQILVKAPQIIAIIKSIIDVIGSEQVQEILETIRETLKQETLAEGALPKNESQRVRLGERLRKRFNENC